MKYSHNRLSNKSYNSSVCLSKNISLLNEAFKNTNNTMSRLMPFQWKAKDGGKKNYDFFTSSGLLRVESEIFEMRSKVLTASNCSARYLEMTGFYSILIKECIDHLPSFHEAELSKITFMHIHALQDILEAYEDFSLLCCVEGMQLQLDETKILFISLISTGSAAIDRSLEGDNSLLHLYEGLKNKFPDVHYILDEGGRLEVYEKMQENPLIFRKTCRQVGMMLKQMAMEVYHGEKEEGFEKEWNKCLTGEFE